MMGHYLLRVTQRRILGARQVKLVWLMHLSGRPIYLVFGNNVFPSLQP